MEPNKKLISELNSELLRVEIDSQISTTKTYPRSLKKFLENAQSMISLNENIAASYCYTLPRKEKVLINGNEKQSY